MSSESTRYCPHIDGLRAIAVLSVMLYHADLGLGGGFAGVDVFFVISGYLITGLILKGLEGGTFSLAEFWERRVRRIIPPLAVVVLTTLLVGWFILMPSPLTLLARSAFMQALMCSNFHFWMASGYFDTAATTKPLLHTWSLAVEEQFYLLFPLFLMSLRRLAPRTRTIWITILLLASFVLSVYCNFYHPKLNFFLFPPRAWELLLGALLASSPVEVPLSKRMSETLGWAGLVAVLYPFFFYDRNTLFPGLGAMPPCVGAAMIIWTNRGALNGSGRLLSWRPLVFVGLISYSLYLWHWPLLVLFNQWSASARGSVPVRLGLLLASLFLAVLSWKFVETPFRRRVVFRTRNGVFLFAASSTAMLLFLSNLVIDRSRQALEPPWVPYGALRIARQSEIDIAYNGDIGSKFGLKEALAENFIEMGKADRDAPVDLLVWGDSHAVVVTHILKDLCKEYGVRGVAAVHGGTSPLIGYATVPDSVQFNQAIADYIRKNRVRVVVIVAMWSHCVDWDGAGYINQALSKTIDTINPEAPRILIMRQVPLPNVNVPQLLYSTILNGGDPDQMVLPLSEHVAELKRQDPCFTGLPEKYPNVRILDPTEYFVNRERNGYRLCMDGKSLFFDGLHISAAGSMLLRPMFEPVFKEIREAKQQGGNATPAR